jgi:hypothetical protein
MAVFSGGYAIHRAWLELEKYPRSATRIRLDLWKDLADIFFTNPSGGHHDHRFRGRGPSHSHMSNEDICDTCSALQECKKRDGQRHQRCLILASDPDISVIATALKLTSWSINRIFRRPKAPTHSEISQGNALDHGEQLASRTRYTFIGHWWQR